MSGDNKYRPYYDHDSFNAGYSVIYKPGVGLIDTATHKEITSSFGHNLSNNKPSILGSNTGLGISGMSAPGPPRADRFTSAAEKNYLNDLELSEYFDFNNLSEVFKNLVWNFCKNYCRVLLSQPLDIVRLVLQVGYFRFPSDQPASKPPVSKSAMGSSLSDSVDDSIYDDEDIDFFQPSSPSSSPATLPKDVPDLTSKPVSKVKNPHKIHPISQHTVDIMTAIVSKDGPFALFRGINASFIHYTLSHTIEAWITGFISPFLNIPDPFFLDLTHSTEPAKSLWLSVSACVLTGVILMPLDLIKVRFMLTPFNKVPLDSTERPQRSSRSPKPPSPHDGVAADEASPLSDSLSDLEASHSEQSATAVNVRSVRDSLRHYPPRLFFKPPPSITILTILYQTSTVVFRKSAPYFLFVRYNIDSYSAPSLYTVSNLLLSIIEFFFKLPVENLLRKEQVRFLLKPKSPQDDKYGVVTIPNPDKNLIVDFNGWNRPDAGSDDASELGLWARIKRLGLFKGWRVGVLNVIGFWGYNILNSTSVTTEERL